MMSIFQLKESASALSHQGIMNVADSIPDASYQHCSCLFSDPSRSHPQEECTLASPLHTSSEKAVQIRKYQFALLKRQWSSKGRVDGRSERLLDGVITDVRNGVYPALGNYLDVYTMFQSELLGSGSNGRIFRARRRADGKMVAVKIILCMSKGVLREIEMLRHCRHSDFVVEIFDSYLAPKEVISMIVMSLDGHQWLPIPKKLQHKQRVNVSDLQAFMTAVPHPDESILTLIISQLIHILHFLHSDRLIMHGDVKPSNFLIDLDFKIKITDFSTCQDISQSPIQTNFKGTMFYASPSVQPNEPYDGRLNDMWALGMTIYALVYGWKEPPVFMTHQKYPAVLLPEVSYLSNSFQSVYSSLLNVLFNQDPHFDALEGFQQQLDIWNNVFYNKQPGIKVVKDNQWVEVQISKSWIKKISKIAKKWL